MATAKLKVPILLEWKDIEAYMGQYDIVEVVRCKDCKHREEYECNNIMLGGTKCGVTDDWFCADGERRDDGNG